MLVLLTIALLVALVGVIKPFKGFQRKHFGMAAAVLFVACLIATPTPDRTKVALIAAPGQMALPPEAQTASADAAKAAFKSKPAGAPAAASEEEVEPALTPAQMNAVRNAEQYLSMSGFSRKGLVQQLSSEAGNGYSVADATAAVDSLTVDWNENAARSAKQYLEMSGFSCRGLIEQLSSRAGNDYTVSQATYGARQAGAC